MSEYHPHTADTAPTGSLVIGVKNPRFRAVISSSDEEGATVAEFNYTYEELRDEFTTLDGKPCGRIALERSAT